MDDAQYYQILTGKYEPGGITIADKKRILIFLYLYGNVEKKPNQIIHFIGNIYHEIRHACQANEKLFSDEKEISTIDGDLESYYRLPSEKDAYKFQVEQIQINWEKILEIFGYKTENLVFKYELKKEIMNAIKS